MNIETLKKLIEVEFDRSTNISHFKTNVMRLIDLYEEDKGNKSIADISIPEWDRPNLWPPSIYPNGTTQTMADICSCNPKNGGSGICGCTIGNKLVEHPFLRTYSTSTANVGKVDNENSND